MDFNTQMAIETIARSAVKIFATQATATSAPRAAVKVRTNEIDPPANVELDNYTKKQTSEDGRYVIVVEHSEWVQGIPQPLTSEEKELKTALLEAQNERTKQRSKIIFGIGLTTASVAGVIYLFRDRINA